MAGIGTALQPLGTFCRPILVGLLGFRVRHASLRSLLGSVALVRLSCLVPGSRWSWLQRFAAFDTVVVVEVAGGAQRLVVQTYAAGHLGQLFGKPMNRLQLLRRGGQFVLARLQKFLVA